MWLDHWSWTINQCYVYLVLSHKKEILLTNWSHNCKLTTLALWFIFVEFAFFLIEGWRLKWRGGIFFTLESFNYLRGQNSFASVTCSYRLNKQADINQSLMESLFIFLFAKFIMAPCLLIEVYMWDFPMSIDYMDGYAMFKLRKGYILTISLHYTVYIVFWCTCSL